MFAQQVKYPAVYSPNVVVLAKVFVFDLKTYNLGVNVFNEQLELAVPNWFLSRLILCLGLVFLSLVLDLYVRIHFPEEFSVVGKICLPHVKDEGATHFGFAIR